MTPDEAARALRCRVCRGPVHATRSKPWRFRCTSCAITLRADDIGALQGAIARRAAERQPARAGAPR